MRARLTRCLLVIGAALGLTFATAVPAFATQGGVCETFGSWCLGDPGGSSLGDLPITVAHPGITMIFGPGPGGTGTLHFADHTGLCIAPTSSQNLIIHVVLCNATGVSWTWVSAPTSHYFVSVHYPGLRLSGTSAQGDHWAACPAGGCSGNFTLQQLNGP